MAATEAAAAAASTAEAQSRLRAEQQGLAARRDALEQQLRDGTDERVRPLACGPAAVGASLTGSRWSRTCGWPWRRRWVTCSSGLVLDARRRPGAGRRCRRAGAARRGRSPAIGATGPRSGPSRASRRPSSLPVAAGSRGPCGSTLTATLPGCWRAAAWVPDLDAALALRALLPAGWRLVTRAGVVVDDLAVVRPAPGVSTLERRAALEDMTRQATRLEADLESAAAAAAEAAAARSRADARVAAAGVALDAARRSRRLADEADRSMASAAENAARERAWQEALLGRAQVEAAAAAEESALRAGELQALDEAAAGERPGTRRHRGAGRRSRRAPCCVRAERDRLAAQRGRVASRARARPRGATPRGGRPGTGRGPPGGAGPATRWP